MTPNPTSAPLRIALFDAVGTYFSAPTLRCILEEFDAAGAQVDVFLRLGGQRLSEVSRASAHPFPVPLRPWAGDVESTLRNWKWFFRYRAAAGWRRLRSQRYDLAIGLNPEGVIAAHCLHNRSGTPFAYLSFEMMFRDELATPGPRLEKTREILASRRAALVLIQDTDRAALLARENGLDPDTFMLLPVAPRGGPEPVRSTALREQHGIQAHQTVVLHSGTFGLFTRSDGLMDTLPQWPADYVLLVNTFYPHAPGDRFLARLKSLNLPNVRLACGALSPADHETLVAGADIGLAIYHAPGGSPFAGKNVATMGLSSGKLSTYTRAGLPVLCSGNPSLKPHLARYPFGEHTQELRAIPTLLSRIRQDWPARSKAARRFFLEQLDFDRFWPPVWIRLQQLARPR